MWLVSSQERSTPILPSVSDNSDASLLRVVIVGVTGFRNRGVEALVRPIVDHLLAEYPQIHITIASWSPEFDSILIADPRVSFVQDNFLVVGRWGAGIAPGLARKDVCARMQRSAYKKITSLFCSRLAGGDDVMPFVQPDLLLVSGGDIYSSDYGQASLRHFVEPLLWARRRGVPCALIGHSIGRFFRSLDVSLWRQAESASTVIALRESLSKEYLINQLSSSSDIYELTADVAFLLKPQPISRGDFAHPLSVPTVAVSISAGICQWSKQNAARHISAWVAVLRMILDEWNADIVIVPHVQEPFSDDRTIASHVVRRLPNDRRVKIVRDPLNAGELKWLISGCELLLAERMHAAIAGFSTGVATVAIGYSIKAQGIVRDVLAGTKISEDELGMPLSEFIDVERSLPRLSRVWHDRSRIQAALASTADRLRRASRRNLEIIDDLLMGVNHH